MMNAHMFYLVCFRSFMFLAAFHLISAPSDSSRFFDIRFCKGCGRAFIQFWVHLQHQGYSWDREKRELERRDLRILVGTNLIRLGQLDGVDLDLYQKTILPSILKQVINCKDIIAQEYLSFRYFISHFHSAILNFW